MSGCWFSHARFLISKQQLNWETDAFIAILLQENSAVLADSGAETVSDIGPLSEFTGSGYSRQALVNTEIIENVGINVAYVADIVLFANLGNAPKRARYILVAKDGANDGVRVPMFVIGRALGPIHPNGGSVGADIEAIW